MHPPTPILLHETVICGFDTSFDSETVPLTLPWHCHDEYELIHITRGCGREFVAGAVERFAPGTLTLIGCHTPHLHLGDTADGACGIVRFPETVLPRAAEQMPEFRGVVALLAESRCGVRFAAEAPAEGGAAEAARRMQALGAMRGVERIAGLYSLLELLARTPRRPLGQAVAGVAPPAGRPDGAYAASRYLAEHFREHVTLDELARHTGMHAAALCWLFRSRTGMTLFDCLARLRVQAVCRWLATSDLPVSQIAWECGFNSLSHFNACFRRVTGLSPQGYRAALRRTVLPSPAEQKH